MSTAASDLAMSVAVIGKILAPHGGSSAAYRQLVADVDRVVQELLAAEATGRAAVRVLDTLWRELHLNVCPEDGECESAGCIEAQRLIATDTARAWLEEGT